MAARIRTDFVTVPQAREMPAEYTSRAFGAGGGALHSTGPHHTGDGPRAFVVFNPLASPRHDLVKLTVWDGDEGPAALPLQQRSWRAVLADGTIIPAQICASGAYWGHNHVECLAPVSVPPLGWHAVALEEGPASPLAASEAVHIEVHMDGGHEQRQPLPGRTIGLKNKTVSLEIDRCSGGISSLKYAAVEFAAAPFAILEHHQERPLGMSAWMIGDAAGSPQPLTIDDIKIVESGPYRAAVEVRMHVNESQITVTYALTTTSSIVHVGVKARWLERGSAQTGIPRLQIALPCLLTDTQAMCEVPFGVVTRDDLQGHAVPALRWAAIKGSVGDKQAGVQLLNDGAHGYALEGGTLRLHLLRSSYDPDPLPEIGDHAWRLGVAP